MTLRIEIPELLARQASELAARQNVSVDQLVASALTAQVSAASTRPSIAERAKRADWKAVEDILNRVPHAPPLPGDER